MMKATRQATPAQPWHAGCAASAFAHAAAGTTASQTDVLAAHTLSATAATARRCRASARRLRNQRGVRVQRVAEGARGE